MPERIQLQRTRGWRKPAVAVVVSRPTRWGNPYVIGALGPIFWIWRNHHWVALIGATEHVETRAQAVDMFRRIARQPEFIADVRRELAGRDLCCWCPLDQPCHADVLLEYANR